MDQADLIMFGIMFPIMFRVKFICLLVTVKLVHVDLAMMWILLSLLVAVSW